MRKLIEVLLPVAAALVLAGTIVSPALAAPADTRFTDFEAGLKAFDVTLSGEIAVGTPAAELIREAGFEDILRPQDFLGVRSVGNGADVGVLRPVVSAVNKVEARPMNMRLALTMLSQSYGGEDNLAVVNAQSQPDLLALSIQSGRVTLDDVRKLLVAFKLQEVPPEAGLTLKVPLVIWKDATLILRPGEVLQMSRTDGAFLVSFGHLEVQGATIEMTGTNSPGSHNFQPFVIIADAGTLQMNGARVANLGFGETPKFSGFAILRGASRGTDRKSWIENSRFEGLDSLTLSGADNLLIRGNHFRDNRSAALVVSRSKGVSVLSNLFSGRMSTNAVRMEDGSSRGWVSGNLVMTGDRAGIIVRKESHGVTIANNIIWGRKGSGVSVAASDCVLLEDNVLLRNGQKGIEVRDSQQARILRNQIAHNHNAGVWVSGQEEGFETVLQDNELVGNGSGVSGATSARIVLAGNDFTRQLPQFLSGDIAAQSRLIAENAVGATPMVMTANGLVEAAPPAMTCEE
jgi:poly(beta-D-mannuronate) C5 epimerase